MFNDSPNLIKRIICRPDARGAKPDGGGEEREERERENLCELMRSSAAVFSLSHECTAIRKISLKQSLEQINKYIHRLAFLFLSSTRLRSERCVSFLWKHRAIRFASRSFVIEREAIVVLCIYMRRALVCRREHAFIVDPKGRS